MTLGDWSVAFGLGLAGSLHCTQMCGPLVVAGGGNATSHLAYNTGRVMTYAALGAIAGAIGELGVLMQIERWTTLALAAVLVIAGLRMFGVTSAQRLVRIDSNGIGSRLMRRAAPMLMATGAANRIKLGLLLGLLPCGLVWAALVKAASTGTMFDGGATMLAFGAGTAGALLASGIFAAPLQRHFARHGGRIAASAMIAAGLFIAWRGSIAPPQSGGPACHGHQQN